MTESARKNIAILVIVSAILVVGAGIISSVSNTPSLEKQAELQINRGETIGRIGEAYFNFNIADTTAERTQGLSGKEQLKDTQALLFAFDSADKHCFWMKDMKFAIDILWFDADKKLVYEKRGITPETYPESFCPEVPAKYVVEVTAGVAEKNQIKLGDTLDINL